MLQKHFHEKDILKLLSDLVSIPSHDNERDIVDYIARRLKKLGVEYEVTEVVSNRENLTAFMGEGERSLILNTHTDTVPPGEAQDWKQSPFDLIKEDAPSSSIPNVTSCILHPRRICPFFSSAMVSRSNCTFLAFRANIPSFSSRRNPSRSFLSKGPVPHLS